MLEGWYARQETRSASSGTRNGRRSFRPVRKPVGRGAESTTLELLHLVGGPAIGPTHPVVFVEIATFGFLLVSHVLCRPKLQGVLHTSKTGSPHPICSPASE